VIELRRVETDEDVDVFLALRRAIDPEHMMSRVSYVEELERPERVDLIASLGGEPVGCAFVEPHGENVAGPIAWVSVRVLREHRRRGIGTVLFREVSAIARAGGKDSLIFPARHDDADSLDYLGKRGFVEALRLRESVLDLEDARSRFDPPEGVAIVELEARHEREVYDAAVVIARDIPAAQERLVIGSFEEWRAQELRVNTARDCSFVALFEDAVIGYAILVDNGDGVGLHVITGVLPAWRRRGVALALKQAQIDAARARGLRSLRTANAMDNPMRLVNERLGYRRNVDWLHLRGPLLDRGEAARVPRSR
jgi:GNAT superfamily N-acetyltransferase